VLYLTGCLPVKPEVQQQLLAHNIGVICTPYSQRSTPTNDWIWAADNGCFSNKWDKETWHSWLLSLRNKQQPLFATVPDVVGDHHGTLQQWNIHAQQVKDMGFRTAFVLQNNATIHNIPLAEFDALFIGGTTDFKLSEQARTIVRMCKENNKWVHMGRVNSATRIHTAFHWGCDSVDGTYLAYSPDANTPRLIRMMNTGTQPTLF